MGVKQNCLQNLPLSSVSYNPGVSVNGSGRGVRSRLLIPNCVPLGEGFCFREWIGPVVKVLGVSWTIAIKVRVTTLAKFLKRGHSLEHLMRTFTLNKQDSYFPPSSFLACSLGQFLLTSENTATTLSTVWQQQVIVKRTWIMAVFTYFNI